MNKFHFRWAAAAVLVLFLTGCESMRFSMMKDDELVNGGIQAWNTGRVEAARAYWTNIKVPATRTTWLARLDQEAALEKTFDETAALPPSPEAPLVAGWNDCVAQYAAFPAELKLPAELKPQLVPTAKAIVRDRINANQIASAKDFIKTSSDFLGPQVDFTAEQKEMETIAAWKALEKTADGVLANARTTDDFNSQIAAYEDSIAAYAKVEATLTDWNKQVAYPQGSPLTTAPDKLKRKRVDTRVEMEHKLRDRAYSFKDRIGEEFARTPPDEDKATGSSAEAILKSDQAILKFNQEIQTNIEGMQKELVDFSVRYPKAIDKDMLKDVDAQKQALEARIAQIAVELKDVQEIVSRGKPVAPLLIGLFNPQPGSKGNDQKSRPAKFHGIMSGQADYLWGMVEVPQNTLNDLVITVKDNRTVRVFAENTKSGTQIESKKLKDLVNRGNKVGNSWPVMNAGSQLASGKYYFEVQSSKDAAYSGDVVVYSSFIARMR
jgi:hypothetical protein